MVAVAAAAPPPPPPPPPQPPPPPPRRRRPLQILHDKAKTKRMVIVTVVEVTKLGMADLEGHQNLLHQLCVSCSVDQPERQHQHPQEHWMTYNTDTDATAATAAATSSATKNTCQAVSYICETSNSDFVRSVISTFLEQLLLLLLLLSVLLLLLLLLLPLLQLVLVLRTLLLIFAPWLLVLRRRQR